MPLLAMVNMGQAQKPDRKIVVEGAREGPLTGADLEIPLQKLVCLSGRSGAGNRTLAVDVLWAESRRRYMMALSPQEREKLGGVRRVAVDSISGLPPAALVDGSRIETSATVASFLQLDLLFARMLIAGGKLLCPHCGGRCASFSSEAAAEYAIERCAGRRCLLIAPLEWSQASTADSVLAHLLKAGFRRLWIDQSEYLLEQGELADLPTDGPIAVVVDRIIPKKTERQRIVEAVNNARAISRGRAWLRELEGEVDLALNRDPTCIECGRMFRPASADTLLRSAEGVEEEVVRYRLEGKSLSAIQRMSCGELGGFLKGVADPEGLAAQAGRLLAEILNLGMSGMTPAMPSSWLSRSERLLLELASRIAERMAGLVYIFENPTAGMTEGSTQDLISGLRALVTLGNTVVVVDNSETLKRAADATFELSAGKVGAASLGTPARSRTRPRLEIATKLLISVHDMPLFDAVDLELPCRCLVAVCGPAAAGKTFFLTAVLAPALGGKARGSNTVAVADEAGKRRVVLASSRSEVPKRSLLAGLGISGYVGRLFAAAPAAVERGYSEESFQLESPGGRCSHCEGSGFLSYDLALLEEIAVECPRCQGRRFKDEILEVTLKGANISDLLSYTVDQSREYFARDAKIRPLLDAVLLCGLGHLKLGQVSSELESGQRILLQLALELPRARSRDFIIVTDCSGLDHAEDLETLVRVADGLVAKGATVLVESNDPTILEEADWWLEFGEKTEMARALVRSCESR